MMPHISCRAAYQQIRNIRRIRRYLTPEAFKTLVHSTVTSHLDYGNALLYGLPESVICKLQRVQNTAASLITKTPRNSHITPVLRSLHWLPVSSRIEFKILLYTYKALNSKAPHYLSDLLVLDQSTSNLRSHSAYRLKEPRTYKQRYGDRAFAKAAPHLWNKLPLDIKKSPSVDAFKNKLKTHMFKSLS